MSDAKQASPEGHGRRAFFTRLGLGTLVVGVVACGKKEPAGPTVVCNDLTGLTDPDKATRVTFKYVDVTPDPSKRCDGCQFYIVPEGAAPCGGCKLVKGPVAPAGYCTSFAVKG